MKICLFPTMREADVVGFNEMEIEAERLVLIKARDRFKQERKHQRSKAGRQRPLWKQQLPSLPEPKPENYLDPNDVKVFLANVKAEWSQVVA